MSKFSKIALLYKLIKTKSLYLTDHQYTLQENFCVIIDVF